MSALRQRFCAVVGIDVLAIVVRTKTVRATGVGELHDIGTWECDGIVRCPVLDDGKPLGYAVVDTDDNETLRFNALGIEL